MKCSRVLLACKVDRTVWQKPLTTFVVLTGGHVIVFNYLPAQQVGVLFIL
jgi:hypothetical protein